MTKKQAVQVLKEQKAKLRDAGTRKDETWVFNTASFISLIFGRDSLEYHFIRQVRLTVVAYTEKEADAKFGDHFEKIETYLDNCIAYIERFGLPSLPKANIFSRDSNGTLVAFFIAVAGGVGTVAYSLGNYTSNVQNIELKQEVRQLKARLAVPVHHVEQPRKDKEQPRKTERKK